MNSSLWDIRSNNILDARETKSEAIRTTVREHGDLAVEFPMLLEDDPKLEDKTLLGIGSELLAYVRDAGWQP